MMSCVACGTRQGKTVPTLKEHHIVNLFESKQPFCICTDDCGVFATTLSKEYMAAAEALGVSRAGLWEVAYTAIDHIFACNATKHSLRLEMAAKKGAMLLL